MLRPCPKIRAGLVPERPTPDRCETSLSGIFRGVLYVDMISRATPVPWEDFPSAGSESAHRGPRGGFVDDPVDVPAGVADYLAEQLGIPDASVLKTYGERENTRLDHVRELREAFGYREFAGAEAELRAWVDARAWTAEAGPKALFDAAVGWLRERRVLVPGVTTSVRLNAVPEQAAEIAAFGVADLDVAAVPPRRLAELSR